ncbi:hypothetical protein IVA95_23525 [Bradyrhizobium sp. 157]|uniref:hypothetical protein n=1 Tax=Bradyrhizobium sp. 157 TaxID=2782631 RepID=UPI001FFA8A0B|nr:hypothetical protein [Bradyrhizobium sp. 157]MCK1640473.1 hypothetical protein [Bradyrhizobium sp. 157]
MAFDPKFTELVSVLAEAKASADHRRAEEQRLDEEGIAAAKAAFEPIQNFLKALEAALKQRVASHYQVTETDWIVGAGRDVYMVCYKIAFHEIIFYVSNDFSRLEFERHDFAISDVASIEQAIKDWVIAKLRR